MLLHERFKAERERLGLTQPQVAALCEVGKTTVINWEKAASSPTAAQLEVLSQFGMDPLYVVTGQHAGGATPAPALSAEEATLLEYFRAAKPAVRRAAIGALAAGTAPAGGGGQVMQHTGSGNVQIGSVGGNYSSSTNKPR